MSSAVVVYRRCKLLSHSSQPRSVFFSVAGLNFPYPSITLLPVTQTATQPLRHQGRAISPPGMFSKILPAPCTDVIPS
jgi:hypothetical protein